MKVRARIAPLLVVGAIASALFRLDAQVVIVRDAGPGPVGRRLAQALAAPHQLIPPDTARAILPRDSAFAQTVIVLHRDAVIEARVHGDVIVVGGDAFLHPGALVDGRVIAIGGGVYESRLAITRAVRFQFEPPPGQNRAMSLSGESGNAPRTRASPRLLTSL